MAGGLAVAAVGGLATYVLRPPSPVGMTGQHSIGTRTYRWSDDGRPELFGNAAMRRVVAQVWYPSQGSSGASPAPYLAEAKEFAVEASRLFGAPSVVFAGLRRARSNAVADAPPLQGKHPLVVVPVALGGMRQTQSYLVDELASRGYVVMALDQPGASAVVVDEMGGLTGGLDKAGYHRFLDKSLDPGAESTDGADMGQGIAPYLGADVSFALDRIMTTELAEVIDIERVAALGISLGGLTAAQACHDDRRLQACVAIEAPIPHTVWTEGVFQPVLVLTRTEEQMREEREASGGWEESEIAQHQESMHGLVYHSAEGSAFATVDDAFHIDFTDVPRWSPLFTWLGLVGPDPAGVHRIVCDAVVAFLDQQLRGVGDGLARLKAEPRLRVG